MLPAPEEAKSSLPSGQAYGQAPAPAAQPPQPEAQKYRSNIRTISAAVIIVILAVAVIFVSHVVYAPHQAVTITMPAQPSLPVPGYVNTTLSFAAYQLSTQLYAGSYPIYAIYAYVNKHSSLQRYGVSYNESSIFNGTSSQQSIFIQRNGSNLELNVAPIHSTPGSTPQITLYGVKNTYYWCVQSIPCIVLNDIPNPLDNLSQIDSISFAAHQIDDNVSVSKDYINVMGSKNASYGGINCTYDYGDFDYLISDKVTSYAFSGNFSECMSGYGIPLMFNVTGSYAGNQYAMQINETSFSVNSPAISAPS